MTDEISIFWLLLYGSVDIINNLSNCIIFVSEGESEVSGEVGGGIGLLNGSLQLLEGDLVVFMNLFDNFNKIISLRLLL